MKKEQRWQRRGTSQERQLGDLFRLEYHRSYIKWYVFFLWGSNYNYFHHIFLCDRLDSLIDAITSLAPLWLVSLSVTPCEGQILGRTIGCHIFYKTRQLGLFLSIVCFQMCPQMACLGRCKIVLIAFVRLFSTVCFQMSPQSTCITGCKITLVAFVWLFSTVCF